MHLDEIRVGHFLRENVYSLCEDFIFHYENIGRERESLRLRPHISFGNGNMN